MNRELSKTSIVSLLAKLNEIQLLHSLPNLVLIIILNYISFIISIKILKMTCMLLYPTCTHNTTAIQYVYCTSQFHCHLHSNPIDSHQNCEP